MSIYDTLFAETQIPQVVPVEYNLPRGEISRDMVPQKVAQTIEQSNVLQKIKPGQTIAIAAGSREISNIDLVVKQLADMLLKAGAKPFIIPAMGSHGGATAQGQKEILAGYGITEEAMGIPIRATMDTVPIGETPSGLRVCIDRYADEADGIIPVGRIKAHTDFRGKIESGLMKMLAIGCGKQYGAHICHTMGFPSMSKNVTEIARVILEKKVVPFGIGILEDAFHNTYQIQAVAGEVMEQTEEELLVIAKKLVPCIPFEKIDVLVLEEIGKDISGAGMDPNVTGRSIMLGSSKPFVERIAVLDLSEKSHHSGAGIGGADVTTRRFFSKMDLDITYPNGITSHDPQSIKIPAIMPNDRDAIRMALQTCVHNDPKLGYRMVMMKNTLHLNRFFISTALMEEAKKHPDLTIVGQVQDIVFDANGNLPHLA